MLGGWLALQVSQVWCCSLECRNGWCGYGKVVTRKWLSWRAQVLLQNYTASKLVSLGGFFVGGHGFLCIFLSDIDSQLFTRLSSVCVKWREPGCRRLFLSGCWDATTAPRGSWDTWQPWKITLGLLKQPIMIRRSSSTTGEWVLLLDCVSVWGEWEGVEFCWAECWTHLHSTHTQNIYICIYICLDIYSFLYHLCWTGSGFSVSQQSWCSVPLNPRPRNPVVLCIWNASLSWRRIPCEMLRDLNYFW